jgi:hypothetical protein
METNKQISFTELVKTPDLLRQFNELATIMATGSVTVPSHLRKSHGDCFAIIIQAAQWGMNPFAVAQKTFLVNGILGYEAQLVNAVIQSSGAIQGRFHYEFSGSGLDLSCRVGAVIQGESDITWTEWLKSSQVIVKNSPLWKTNPKQQMGYLQVKNWARIYCPGALLGVYSEDELQSDYLPLEKEVNSLPDPVEVIARNYCTDENFAEKSASWCKLIESGKKSADTIISMVETKYLFTDEQKEIIKSWEVNDEPA